MKKDTDVFALSLHEDNNHVPVKKRKTPWFKNLAVHMVLALVIGIGLGHFYPDFAILLSPLSAAFLKMIKALVGLVIFCTIAVGIASIGSGASVGRIGIKSLIYFEVMTTFAMILGLVVVKIFQPGEGMNIDVSSLDTAAISSFVNTATHRTAVDWLMTIIPDTFISAFTNGNLLPVLLMATLFGVALLKMGSRADSVTGFIERCSEALFGIVGMIMKLAPIAVMGALAFTVGKYGIITMIPLVKFLGLFYISCLVFIGLALGAVCIIAKVNLWKVIKYIRVELLLAFGTASSEAVLPSMMIKLQELGCRKHIVGFVIPAGFSFNLDGSSMYFIMAIVFIAQACNISLSIHQEIILILIFMVTSKGIAGVAGAGFVTLAATLAIYPHVPLAGIVLLLGIDRFMDAMRTVTNLIGNAVATLVIARWESELDDQKMNAVLK